MRMIVTLAALLLVALLVTRQLQSPTTTPAAVQRATDSEVPSVPTRPQDVPQFEQNMNNFINQAAEDQAREIESATQ